MAKKRDQAKIMNVAVFPGQSVIVKTSPKAEDFDRPFFSKWMSVCTQLPSDVWPRAIKHHPKCGRVPNKCACSREQINISDMHTMELVNSIKWCVKTATRYINGNFNLLGTSRAQLLAMVPQWGNLLLEAKKRDLKILGREEWAGEEHYADWFREAMTAIGMRALEG